jgi:hypothetical protein
MDLTELENEHAELLEKRNNLFNYALVWSFVLFFSLIIPRILRRVTPTLFIVGLVVLSSILTVSGLMLLAKWIGIQQEIRAVKADMKHAKAKRNIEDVISRYEVGDDGELIEINGTESHQQVD